MAGIGAAHAGSSIDDDCAVLVEAELAHWDSGGRLHCSTIRFLLSTDKVSQSCGE